MLNGCLIKKEKKTFFFVVVTVAEHLDKIPILTIIFSELSLKEQKKMKL